VCTTGGRVNFTKEQSECFGIDAGSRVGGSDEVRCTSYSQPVPSATNRDGYLRAAPNMPKPRCFTGRNQGNAIRAREWVLDNAAISDTRKHPSIILGSADGG
jgi:hypothetical protein